jgi:hypothetical protein
MATETRELALRPLCLTFFLDETGNETFADPHYPVFALGGCAMMASHLDLEIRFPWQSVKAKRFSSENYPLHAADFRDWSPEQINAIAEFFKAGRFMRFASVIHKTTALPPGITPLQVVASDIITRFEEVTSRWSPRPVEVAFIHESSQRGDKLLESHIGKLTLLFNGVDSVPVHQGFLEKRKGESGLEVADFIVNAAGGQALGWSQKKERFRPDFQAVFNVPNYLTSFRCIETVQLVHPQQSAELTQ